VGDVWNFKNPYLKLAGVLAFAAVYATIVLVSFFLISLLSIYMNATSKWLHKLDW